MRWVKRAFVRNAFLVDGLHSLIGSQAFRDAKGEFAFPFGLASADAERLIRRALRRAGRRNFSDLSFVQPLNLLLKACAEEANLSFFGRHAARYDLERCLANLLRLDAAEEEDPWITARPIRRPVFITGMPRSASSFLHRMLSLDPGNGVPRCWQTLYPYPRSRLVPPNLRKLQVATQLRMFRCLTPGLGRLHHLSADAPQECTDITAHIFQSFRFETVYHIPSYHRWIDGQDHHAAFQFHRRFLQHLDAQMPGRRWILKSPDHVFALDAIRTVYPDADIVFLHRDPLKVVASCATLTEGLRRPFTKQLDPREVGRQVSLRQAQAADRMMDAAIRLPRILHLHYREVVEQPMAAIRKLYRHCGLELEASAEQRMKAFLARPRRRAPRVYDLARAGLDAASLRERFAAYVRHFAVPEEASSLPGG